MDINSKSESVVYKAWRKDVNRYHVIQDKYDTYTESSDINPFEEELRSYFGRNWKDFVDIHEFKVIYERIK
ncbi:MAG: hypothetical protein AABY22_08530 [Nanoarchaeota archaeon]